jgi:hypothetical protein
VEQFNRFLQADDRSSCTARHAEAADPCPQFLRRLAPRNSVALETSTLEWQCGFDADRGGDMATLTSAIPPTVQRGYRFFLTTAVVMAVINVAAFALTAALGRSTFHAPPIVHAHASVFFGWIAIYVAQNWLAASGSLRLHRRLGWLAIGWMVLMITFGSILTVRMVRLGHVPFFFLPSYFLIMNPVGVLTFAGLSTWAIVLRRQTQWHKRLHLCGMAMIMGPSLGRLLPVPLLIPFAGPVIFFAMLLFPLAGVVADRRTSGKVHPAWLWGIGTMVAAQMFIEVVSRTPIATAIYSLASAGSPGALVAPDAYPPFPPL